MSKICPKLQKCIFFKKWYDVKMLGGQNFGKMIGASTEVVGGSTKVVGVNIWENGRGSTKVLGGLRKW
jgi:hypothetical protein